MLFNSQIFLFLFLPITATGFIYLVRAGWVKGALIWGVFASLFFYGWWNPPYVLLIIASMVFNYTIGLSISKLHDRRVSEQILATGITINLVTLGYFKYYNFFAANLTQILEHDYSVDQILLPLAISFFTFQQIAFLVETYRNQSQFPDIVSYSFFVSFFPQLIAGPIARHYEILPQITQTLRKQVNQQNVLIGLSIFTIGLFKKVAIADRLAESINPIYESSKTVDVVQFWEGWTATFGYYFQIYFDFSAYSDMAMGLGLIFGVRLPQNFNSPYKVTSIIDFWRCWHITLSRFLRDYLYIPLGGSRMGAVRYYRNLLVVMILGGLWHGAAWSFVLWGTVHGILLILNHIWRKFAAERFVDSLTWNTLAWGLTTVCVALTWVLFRTETVSSTFEIYKAISGLNGAGSLEAHYEPLALIAVLWLWVLALPNTIEFFGKRIAHEHFGIAYSTERRSLIRLAWSPTKTWSAIFALLFFWSAINVQDVAEFIYFQF